ncbi:hypothetical protein [Cellulosimicrobium cellulans]|uniref:hypothetical protein n=1 Tax=Cellulosimicrobium cellulans TaxID=1710 RepID=UPI00130EBF3E|nr:hypothetical protein [Cellulosimicrobium cellulans]
MSAQHRQGSARRRAWVAGGAAVLVAAMAGTGALSTLYTSITGNEFRAAVPSDTDRPDGARLVVTGDPIDKTFDTTVLNDRVQATWTLANEGPRAATFDAAFEVRNDVSAELAAAISVDYGVTDAGGAVTAWRSAGTLAAPATFADVLGIDEVAGDASVTVPVRLTLVDPADLVDAGDEGDELRVTADFVVSYLDPLQTTP